MLDKIKEKIDDIKKGDLYALLSVCTREDLNPLVELIKDKLTNSLEQNDDYKKHYPDHTKYYKIIGDEIRWFGGNTLKNLFRGEGPSYDEIVIDVCKKLDVPYEKGKTVENENNILTLFFEKQWNLLDDNEKKKIISEAKKKASIGSVKSFINQTLITRFVFGPPGWSMALFSFSDPAFSVTVPSVIHIAGLRKKYTDYAEKNKNQEIDDKYLSVPQYRIQSNEEFILSDSTESPPVLSMRLIYEPHNANWINVGKEENISRINMLIQQIPGLVTKGEISATKYMEVVIDGPLLKAKGVDGYRLMTQKDGLFNSHGILLDPNKLSSIVNATVLFSFISMAVAQKHLADIDKKLSTISKNIEKIIEFQQNERISSIKSSIDYFNQVARTVIHGKSRENIRNQIESHESILLEKQNHIVTDIENEINKIENIKTKNFFGLNDIIESIKDHQKNLEYLYHQLFLCIRARLYGWKLLLFYPNEENFLKDDRMLSLENDINDFFGEDGSLIPKIKKLMDEKIRSLSVLIADNKSVNKHKLDFLKWNYETIKNITQEKEELIGFLKTTQTIIDVQSKPMNILVKLKNGEIEAICPV